MSTGSPADGAFWNEVVDECIARYDAQVRFLVDNLMESGYPPFTEPMSDREQYDLLTAWRMAGDPRFANDPKAQAEWQRLGQRFATPSPYGVAPAMAPVMGVM